MHCYLCQGFAASKWGHGLTSPTKPLCPPPTLVSPIHFFQMDKWGKMDTGQNVLFCPHLICFAPHPPPKFGAPYQQNNAYGACLCQSQINVHSLLTFRITHHTRVFLANCLVASATLSIVFLSVLRGHMLHLARLSAPTSGARPENGVGMGSGWRAICIALWQE